MSDKHFEEKVKKLYEKAIYQVKSIGISISDNIVKLSINYRAKKRLGCCKVYKVGRLRTYEIEISYVLKDCTDEQILEVIIHELLHTCDSCMNHGTEWKNYSIMVNTLLGYNITTRADYNEIKVNKSNIKYKYEIVCVDCGNRIYRTRKCKLTENIEDYRCGICKGKLRVRSLKI